MAHGSTIDAGRSDLQEVRLFIFAQVETLYFLTIVADSLAYWPLWTLTISNVRRYSRS